MDHFARNRAFLPPALRGGAPLPPPPPFTTARLGHPAAAIDGVSLASSIDPLAEAEKFAAAARGKGALIVYGLGLGYHLEALLALPGLKKLVAVEANPLIVSAAFHARDLSALFGDPRFRLIAATEEAVVAAALSAVMTEGDEYELLVHQPSFRALPASFVNLRAVIETIQSERRFALFFRAQERRNIIANTAAIASSPGVASLYPALRGRPAVVVGAGPSLDRALRHLDRLQSRAHIIAADTALPALLQNGIRPHAVVSADPQPLSAFHFAQGGDMPLIFTPVTHPAVVGLFAGRRYLMVKERHPLLAAAEPLLMARGSVAAGGSVSCLALDLLVRAGAGPLFFAGQDFGYPKGMPYSRGTLMDYSPESPLSTASELGAIAAAVGFAPPLPLTLEGGGEGETRAHLRGYRDTFGDLIARAPRTAFYNLDSRGAAIRGWENLGAPQRHTGRLPLLDESPWPHGGEHMDAALKEALARSVAE